MLQVLFILILFVLITGLGALASVLLVRFFLARLNADLRILIAAIGGAGWIWAPLSIYMIVTEGLQDPTSLIFLGFIAIGFIVVSWPVAFLATRKLDALLVYEPDVFK